MNTDTDLTRQLKTTFDEIVARTPAVGPAPSFTLHADTERTSRPSRLWLASAAAVAALAAGGLLWTAVGRDQPSRQGTAAVVDIAPTSTRALLTPLAHSTDPASTGNELSPTVTAPVITERPGGPTLLPMLESSGLDLETTYAGLEYLGAYIKHQTSAVVARVESDGTMSELYTFVAGDGVAAYIGGVGVSTEARTPRVVEFGGFGYAAWNVDDVPVLLMATHPQTLLDDPAFTITVGSDDRGRATIQFDSLPADFDLLVAPRHFARQSATVRLAFATPGSELRAAGALASLDNPLTNLNLTQGMTISPTQVNGGDAWLVSSIESDHRSVAFSPDGTTWVLVSSAGSEGELLALAGELSFVGADDVGAWMTRYGVVLPEVPFDEPTAFG